MKPPTIPQLIGSLPATLGSYAPILGDIEAALESPQCSLATVAGAIEKEPDLTARLLRLGNSAFYGFPARLATVNEALSLIGIQQVQDLIVASSTIDCFAGVSPDFVDMQLFWRHSLACGIGARVIALARRMPDADKFFVAGLLHDIGRLALFSQVPEVNQELLRLHRQDHGLFRDAELKVLGYDHADIGAALLERWQFPGRLVDLVAYHHRPAACTRAKEEAAVVHLADHLVNAMQLGSSGEHQTPPLQRSAWDTLGLATESLRSLVEAIDSQIDAVEEAFLRPAQRAPRP